MSFIDEFSDFIPYYVNVDIGNNDYILAPELKSSSNFMGKKVAIYRNKETSKESKHGGLQELKKYVPAEEVSMPINIRVNSDEKIYTVYENGRKNTEKNFSEHKIRVYYAKNEYIGCVSLTLTPSGDKSFESCNYRSPDGTKEIDCTTKNYMQFDGKITKYNSIKFQRNSNDLTKKVIISQRDGKIVGCSIIEQEPETVEESMYQSDMDLSRCKYRHKLKTYIAACIVDDTEYNNRVEMPISTECKVLEKDLLEYQKKYSGVKNFKGTYIGNILKLTDKGYKGCIVRKHLNEGKEYRLYTLIDFSGTSITQGSSKFDKNANIDRDPNYLKLLETADKTPDFVTIVEKGGIETLAFYGNPKNPENRQQYDKFVEEFINPFNEIRSTQLNRFFKKQAERDR